MPEPPGGRGLPLLAPTALFPSLDLRANTCTLNQLGRVPVPGCRVDIRWLFLSLRGKERDLREVGTLAVSHTASGGRRTGALDFVATENLSVQLGGEGWVESGLKPGGLLCGGRGSRDKLCWGWKNQAFLSFCPGPRLPRGL